MRARTRRSGCCGRPGGTPTWSVTTSAAYVAEHLGHPGGVLIVDETGFLKKGARLGRGAAAVHRNRRADRERPGRGVPRLRHPARTRLDRPAALPAAESLVRRRRPVHCGRDPAPTRCSRPSRCSPNRRSSTPWPPGYPARWVTADEVYGGDPKLRDALQDNGIGYVLAVACDHRVPAFNTKSPRRRPRRWGAETVVAAAVRRGGRERATLVRVGVDRHRRAPAQHRWLLIRKNITTGELAFYRCCSPTPVTLAELVRVAGTRWAVEECFQTAKDQVGLDQYQVRGWTGWHRFITLAMLALAVLTVMAAQEPAGYAGRPRARHSHRVDRRGGPPPVQRPGHRRDPRRRPDLAQLTLAPQSPSHSPPIPLPEAARHRIDHEVPLEY